MCTPPPWQTPATLSRCLAVGASTPRVAAGLPGANLRDAERGRRPSASRYHRCKGGRLDHHELSAVGRTLYGMGSETLSTVVDCPVAEGAGEALVDVGFGKKGNTSVDSHKQRGAAPRRQSHAGFASELGRAMERAAQASNVDLRALSLDGSGKRTNCRPTSHLALSTDGSWQRRSGRRPSSPAGRQTDRAAKNSNPCATIATGLARR